MTTATAQSPTNGNAGPELETGTPTDGIPPLRGTIRGKTALSLADLEAKVAHYPEPARGPTRAVQAFFVQHCDSNIEQLRGLAVDTLKIERSPEYFSNWIKGYYFRSGGGNVKSQGLADWLNFCEKVVEHDRLTSAGGKLGTIMTGTCRAIVNHTMEIMDLTNPCRIAGIAGPTGSQKTASLKHVVSKLGGWPNAALFECTEGMGVTLFKRELGDLYNCKVGNKAGVLDRELSKQFNPRRMLAIDNIQRAFHSERELQSVFEFLIRMQELRNFPLVLSFTREFHEGTLRQGKAVAYFEQLVGRMGGHSDILLLPEFAPMADLRVIARAYHLHDGEDAMKYLFKWSRQPGRIRVVFKRLWRARQFAAVDGKDRITLDLLKEVDTYIPPAIADESGGAS